ncbi:uncharacterized protein LOC141881592 isoform X2 [Acropora palmata]|uniref:uncharacterized protein LOC141881592 isoform X2 n=1 Tax=Acropora palmata TaxID=6131 RepID=UPI003D9FBC0E
MGNLLFRGSLTSIGFSYHARYSFLFSFFFKEIPLENGQKERRASVAFSASLTVLCMMMIIEDKMNITNGRLQLQEAYITGGGKITHRYLPHHTKSHYLKQLIVNLS